jgi:hypothetical protein
MKQSIKGALLSGLVFPGAGQLALKHYRRGVALMMTVSIVLFYIVKHAVDEAYMILGQLQTQGGNIDINAITSSITDQAAANSGGLSDNIAWILITACWVFGIVDAYIIGKGMDNKKSPA